MGNTVEAMQVLLINHCQAYLFISHMHLLKYSSCTHNPSEHPGSCSMSAWTLNGITSDQKQPTTTKKKKISSENFTSKRHTINPRTPQPMKLPILLSLAFLPFISAHGDHHQEPLKVRPEGLSWQDWHMREEHGLEEYDGKTFFALHDLDNSGMLGAKEILNLYGLVHKIIVGDGSGMGSENIEVTPELQDEVVQKVFSLIKHANPDGISQDEWLEFYKSGGKLPDFGYGSGHHLGFEEEYEEHHWRKYHADQDPDVKIKHKEDIEHELLHHKQEIEETHDRSSQLKEYTKNYLSPININNLRPKYRK